MAQPVQNKFEIISGKGNVILVAPHGHQKDDENTGALTRHIREHLNCYAVINEIYRRPDEDKGEKTNRGKLIANLNDIDSIKKANLKADWLDKIDAFKTRIAGGGKKAGTHKNCYILLIHGARDIKISKINNKADVILGIGRVNEGIKNKDDRSTATEKTIKYFIEHLKTIDPIITAVEAKALERSSKEPENEYAGWDSNNLNQYFISRHKKILNPTVQSIQMEFKKTGFRDNEDNVKQQAHKLAVAIGKLTGIDVQPLTDEIEQVEPETLPPAAEEPGPQEGKEVIAQPPPAAEVNANNIAQTADKIIEIFHDSLSSGLIEAGNLIVAEFFQEDFEAARDPKKRDANQSILQIHRELEKKDITSISQAWLYNAVKVAADGKYIESRQDFFDLHMYIKLPASHKVLLAGVKDDETKRNLISEAGEKKYSFVALKLRIAEVQVLPAPEDKHHREPSLLQVAGNPARLCSGDFEDYFQGDKLKGIRPSSRDKLRTKVAEEIPHLEDSINTLEQKLAAQKSYLTKYQQLAGELEKLTGAAVPAKKGQP